MLALIISDCGVQHARTNCGLEGPGPARYLPNTTQTAPKVIGGAASKGERQWFDANGMPGPGTYTTNAKNSPRAPTYAMGARNPTITVAKTPGPGAYSPRKPASSAGTRVMRNTAGRTEQGRFISAWHSQSALAGQGANPGPKYDLKSSVGPGNAPSYGFGSAAAHGVDLAASSSAFISAQHSKENMGRHGPGPGAYSPRMTKLTTPRCTAVGGKFGRAPQRVLISTERAALPGPGRYNGGSPRADKMGSTFGKAKTYRGVRQKSLARVM